MYRSPMIACRAPSTRSPAGSAHAGECGYIGWALHTLLIFPPPYGFGIAAALCPTREYSGEAGAGANGYGFVAAHALGGHHNLPPNVCDPLVPGVLTPFYSWGDHVVVEYLGRFWDPSYDTSYGAITDMASHRCAVPAVVDFRMATGQFAREMNPHAGGAAVWYRVRNLTDVGFHAGCAWIGPYAANPLPPVPVVIPAPPPQGCCVVM